MAEVYAVYAFSSPDTNAIPKATVEPSGHDRRLPAHSQEEAGTGPALAVYAVYALSSLDAEDPWTPIQKHCGWPSGLQGAPMCPGFTKMLFARRAKTALS